MIVRLTGTILEKTPDYAVVDVQGIGYEVEISAMTFAELPNTGEEVSLHTHNIIREDAHLLMGFSQKDERTLFRTLIKINGVGPKLALAILSGITIDHFLTAIEHESVTSLVAIPGVGKKTAERIIVEMKDKLAKLSLSHTPHSSAGPIKVPKDSPKSAVQDAVSAMIALGFKQNEASTMVMQAHQKDQSANSETLIRIALRDKAN